MTDLAETLDDPRIATTGILNAMLALGGGASTAQRRSMLRAMQTQFGLTMDEAREYAVVGAWVAHQADRPEEAVATLGARLDRLNDAPCTEELGQMVRTIIGDAAGRVPADVDAALARLPRA